MDDIKVEFRKNEAGGLDTYLNGENVEKEIRQIVVSNHVSAVSSLAFVRKRLVSLQQEMGRSGGVILDGRDIGTVVFPNADLKIFMTASPEIRAERRYKEMIAKGDKVSLEEILENVKARDHADSTRKESPLVKADDAVVLDNSNLDPQGQMDWIMDRLRERNRYRMKGKPNIEIDSGSGFCFGVSRAVRMAEEQLEKGTGLTSIGEIVHNEEEVERLRLKGLSTSALDRVHSSDEAPLLFRAHGEPRHLIKG